MWEAARRREPEAHGRSLTSKLASRRSISNLFLPEHRTRNTGEIGTDADVGQAASLQERRDVGRLPLPDLEHGPAARRHQTAEIDRYRPVGVEPVRAGDERRPGDRKSTRLNSSH